MLGGTTTGPVPPDPVLVVVCVPAPIPVGCVWLPIGRPGIAGCGGRENVWVGPRDNCGLLPDGGGGGGAPGADGLKLTPPTIGAAMVPVARGMPTQFGPL